MKALDRELEGVERAIFDEMVGRLCNIELDGCHDAARRFSRKLSASKPFTISHPRATSSVLSGLYITCVEYGRSVWLTWPLDKVNRQRWEPYFNRSAGAQDTWIQIKKLSGITVLHQHGSNASVFIPPGHIFASITFGSQCDIEIEGISIEEPGDRRCHDVVRWLGEWAGRNRDTMPLVVCDQIQRTMEFARLACDQWRYLASIEPALYETYHMWIEIQNMCGDTYHRISNSKDPWVPILPRCFVEDPVPSIQTENTPDRARSRSRIATRA